LNRSRRSTVAFLDRSTTGALPEDAQPISRGRDTAFSIEPKPIVALEHPRYWPDPRALCPVAARERRFSVELQHENRLDPLGRRQPIDEPCGIVGPLVPLGPAGRVSSREPRGGNPAVPLDEIRTHPIPESENDRAVARATGMRNCIEERSQLGGEREALEGVRGSRAIEAQGLKPDERDARDGRHHAASRTDAHRKAAIEHEPCGTREREPEERRRHEEESRFFQPVRRDGRERNAHGEGQQPLGRTLFVDPKQRGERTGEHECTHDRGGGVEVHEIPRVPDEVLDDGTLRGDVLDEMEKRAEMRRQENPQHRRQHRDPHDRADVFGKNRERGVHGTSVRARPQKKAGDEHGQQKQHGVRQASDAHALPTDV